MCLLAVHLRHGHLYLTTDLSSQKYEVKNSEFSLEEAIITSPNNSQGLVSDETNLSRLHRASNGDEQ
ncbi:hypothetical protein PMKS-000656 [Pichia membranifaciens]|uniref:Uncharacterized protein n=1 Tax=Pichia membranifaciens TaxID=4926 RepID=A0A1Q2YCD2_9ASCO|nr:hypothetical protein PMKS-000656 [Pichia membranifaciens]